MSKQKHPVNLDSAIRAFRRGDLQTASQLAQRVLKKKPRSAGTHRLLGAIAARQGRINLAAEHVAKAVAIEPNNADLHLELGEILIRIGDLRRAVAALDKVVKIAPNRPEGYLRLSEAYAAGFEYPRAREILETGLRAVNQADTESMELPLARAAASAGVFDRSEEVFRRCLDRSSESERLEIQVALGSVLREAGRLEEALEQFEAVLRDTPDQPIALAGKIEVLDARNRFEEAEALSRSAIASSNAPDDQIALAVARLAPKVGMIDDAIAYLRKALDARKRKPALQSSMLFALGGLLEKAERYDDAFQTWKQANGVFGQRFSEESYVHSVDVMIDVFSRDSLPLLPRAGIRERAPVYILGMMRSGTSLLEQMLACHSQVAAGGELDLVPQCAGYLTREAPDDAPFPLALRHVDSARINQLAESVRQAMAQVDADKAVHTDKLPLNHVYVGFISLLFPNAKVIHCMRHPLDIGLSCYANGVLPVHRYANDLRHIGLVYREYVRLMKHWHDTLELPILDVQYESMIESPEQTLRTVLDFLGLDWEPQCLEFHKSKRVTQTASIDQVRKPIYSSSIGRYKRFDQHLGPLREALGDLATES